MDIQTIILSILSAIGMSFIITRGTIFKSLRAYVLSRYPKLNDLVVCPMCNAFHCGWINILGAMFIPYFIIFQVACISSISAYVLFLLVKDKM